MQLPTRAVQALEYQLQQGITDIAKVCTIAGGWKAVRHLWTAALRQTSTLTSHALFPACTACPQVDAHLMPTASRHAYGPEQHCSVGVIRLLRAL